MVFWYRNSILASIVSIFGCVIVITGVAGIRDGGISMGAGILVIVAGICIAALGKIISDKKAKKKEEQAQTAQRGKKAGNSAHYTGNTGFTTANKSQSAGKTVYTNGSTSTNAGYTKKTQKSSATLEDVFQKAKSYAEKEEYQKELETLLSGLSIDAGNAVLLNNIGRAYRHTGDYNAALDYYFRSVEADPNDLSIRTNIATAYLYLGKYEQAVHYFEGEVRRLEALNSPDSRSMLRITYANYALCVGRMGDLNQARELLVKAEQAGYENCEVIWNMLMKG